jgi:hypothetical protein
MFVCATEVCWRTGNMSSSIRRAQQGACACVQAAWNARVHSHAAACNHAVAAVACDRMCLRSPSEPCCVTKYWCMCFALEVCATTVCSTLVSSRAGQRQSHAVYHACTAGRPANSITAWCQRMSNKCRGSLRACERKIHVKTLIWM